MNEGLRELGPGLGLHYKVWDPWGQQRASNAKPSFSEAGLPMDLGPAWLPSSPLGRSLGTSFLGTILSREGVGRVGGTLGSRRERDYIFIRILNKSRTAACQLGSGFYGNRG